MQTRAGSGLITMGLKGNRLCRGIKKQLKDTTPLPYVQFTEIKDGQVVEKEVKKIEEVYKVWKPQFEPNNKKGSTKPQQMDQIKRPQPVSPYLGPITIRNPEIFSKKYKWCSCGLSKKQPFCDQSHKGTSFSPVKFYIQEATTEVHFCACKLTKNAPFCDGVTCVKLRGDKANENFDNQNN